MTLRAQRPDQQFKRFDFHLRFETGKQTVRISCGVAIVGGGISGLYVAETLVRLQKETNVCLFERDNRFGGRIRDHRFHSAPSIPVGKNTRREISLL